MEPIIENPLDWPTTFFEQWPIATFVDVVVVYMLAWILYRVISHIRHRKGRRL